MAVNPLQIPGYQLGPDANFSPLANLGQIYRQAEQQRARDAGLAALAADPTNTRALYASGDLSLANIGVQLDRNRVLDGRDSRDFAFRQQEAARAQQNADRSYGLQARSADRLEAAAEDNSPSGRAKVVREYGIEPASEQGRAFILTGKLPEANTTVASQTAQREQAAARIGLTPDNPGYQSYILTGKMPREDAQPLTATDKKAILEADEGVLAARTAIGSLDRATRLSEKAFEGPYASKRGYLASFLGETSDTGKAGIATTQLDNEVTSNALSQLKAIFGGAPTEGERKILLDIQGASSQPHAVRKEIFQRAKNAADARLKFNEQRAQELRGGQFYKPQGSMTRAPVQQTQGITQQQYEALPSGSTFTAPDGTQRIKP